MDNLPTFPSPTISHLLYRTSIDASDLSPTYCDDTGKTGKYFSTKTAIPLGMILEYKKPLDLGIYICAPISDPIGYGKYSFRYLDEEFYFNPNGSLKPHPDLKHLPEEQNICHFEDGCTFIHDFSPELNFDMDDYPELIDEVFINSKNLPKVKLGMVLKPGLKFVVYDDWFERFEKFFVENINDLSFTTLLVSEWFVLG